MSNFVFRKENFYNKMFDQYKIAKNQGLKLKELKLRTT